MILTLKNIGKIEKAVVEMNGITVIAGENNTGKSTVGKVLFSIFNSFYKLEEQIYNERRDNIERILDLLYSDVTNRYTMRVDTAEIAQRILKSSEKHIEDPIGLQRYIFDSIVQYDDNFKSYDNDNHSLVEAANRIREIIMISDEKIFKTVLSKKLDAEFNGQVNNIYNENEGCIDLNIKGKSVSLLVIDNMVMSVSNKFHLNTEVIYIDDPFVLDEQRYFLHYPRYGYLEHRSHLKNKLFLTETENTIINQIITNNKLESIYSKINSICSGELVRNTRISYGYMNYETGKTLDIKNISTGLKTFVILKTLLKNGGLEANGTLILDEPEIHLHPEWQLLFAELIVLIQKEFNMHILLNTHSPYFLNAIEVYAAKYQIADRCKYYMASNDGDASSIEDVSDNIEKIYSTLARPLQDLENERYNNDKC